jgi:hypothetical protein
MSKPSYTTYIRHRVSGIEPDRRAAEKGRDIMIGRDMLEHPDFADAVISPTSPFRAVLVNCATWAAPRSTATSRICALPWTRLNRSKHS